MMRLVSWGSGAFALVFLIAGPARAYDTYPSRVPNGVISGPDRCYICHIAPGGGGARNAFGLAFASNGYTWNKNLAEVDSDGDGWSNGQELGDPFGQWTQGGAFSPRPYLSLPGIDNSGNECAGHSGCLTQASAREPSDRNLCNYAGYDDCANHANCSSSSSNGRGDWSCTCQNGYQPTSPGSGYARTRLHNFTGSTNGQRPYDIYSGVYNNSCVNINECSPNPCGNGSCVENSPGNGYSCNCNTGYVYSGGQSGTCVDENECVTMPGVCGVGTCSNTPVGQYTCTCPPGFGFDGDTCVPTNACLDGSNDCHAAASCAVTSPPESWICTCNAGYNGIGSSYRGTGDNCVDINECVGAPCGVGTCSNSPAGSFTCTCPSGYFFNGSTCADVNECSGTPCGIGQRMCMNTVGGYTCTCDPGYTFDGSTCVDIDECAANPCGMGECSQTAPPGYTCSCEGGYMLSGGTCVDIDECETLAPEICSSDSSCTNSPGDFLCTCNSGFEGDGFNCIDIDECARFTHDCHPDARCTNTVGAFTCTCRDGYEGSGRVCTDIDECSTGTGGCGVNENCINRIGSMNLCVCRPGFRDDGAGNCVAACGDGERTPGEECDDENTADGDGCDSSCVVEPGWACWEPTGEASDCIATCGDEWLDPPHEECDLGAANSDTEVDGCRTNCRLAHCGDGVLDTGEVCDDGDGVSDEIPDACRSTCVPAFCGDGVVDTGEACDPGGGTDLGAEACASSCGGDGGADGGPGAGDGGCGCRVGTERGAPWQGVLGLLVIAALVVRRRRR